MHTHVSIALLCVISNARQAYEETYQKFSNELFSRRLLGQGKSVCEIIGAMYKLDLLPNGNSADLPTSVDHDGNSLTKSGHSQLPRGIS